MDSKNLIFSISNVCSNCSSEILFSRYVREWCAAMATGGILDITPDGDKYFLPVRMRDALLGNDTACMDSLFLLKCLPALTGSDHMERFSYVMKEDGPPGNKKYNPFHAFLSMQKPALCKWYWIHET